MGNFADIRSKVIAQDFDDSYGELTVIEKDDMVVASSKRIATRYRDESGELAWRVSTLYMNAASEVIAVANANPTLVTPTWVPSGLL